MDILSTLIVILLVFFTLRGAFRGFSGELAPLVGLISCIGILWYGYQPIQKALIASFPQWDATACSFYAAIVVAICGGLFFLIVSRLIRKLVSCILPQPFDAILGALTGAVKVFFFISIIGGLFTMGKNQVQAFREASERNPFLAVVSQFWMDQLSAFNFKQCMTPVLQNDAPKTSPTSPHSEGRP